jgi:hypothetical protein
VLHLLVGVRWCDRSTYDTSKPGRATFEPDVPKYLNVSSDDALTTEEAHRVPDDVSQYHQEAWRRFNEVASVFKVADGIDRSEAELLGEAYFAWQLGACGFPEAPQDSGTEWRMPVRFGYTGEALPDPIRVNKVSGVISYAEGPSVQAAALIEIERKRLQEDLRHFSELQSDGR